MGNDRVDTGSARGEAATFSRRQTLRGLAGTALVAGTGLSARLAEATYAAQDEFAAKAVYLNPLMDDGYDLDRLLGLIDRTELNALVIAVKEEGVYVDTGVELFREASTVVPYYDVVAVLDALHAHDIYTIARLVVFKDTPLAEARPDLAVVNAGTGDPWHDMNGVAWVNPFSEEIWAANIDLAVELAVLGFYEIQFDYVRFPTDGDLEAMDFGREVTESVQVETITGFLSEARTNLAAVGAKVGADVFGYTLLLDDKGIGQNVGRIAEVVDYVCPMVYPSHFPNGSLAVDGHPNDFPYETIEISLSVGEEKFAGSRGKIRPWLQDFSMPDMSDYGAAEVCAQIDAAEANGATGWMIWNAASVYHEDAFVPAG
ncbi:MAG TPA: putative glycoside hydrolase [Thermomicrobiales bacterium]|nr:putative glycoside hydrolase [Thermomicrobiales bacterium]